jgi:hypothetical protein
MAGDLGYLTVSRIKKKLKSKKNEATEKHIGRERPRDRSGRHYITAFEVNPNNPSTRIVHLPGTGGLRTSSRSWGLPWLAIWDI